MGKVLYQGKSEGGVYLIYPHKASQLSLSSKVCNSVARLTAFNKSLWHMRLGHPHDLVLKILFPNIKSVINKCNSIDHSWTHYLYGKMHNLPFHKSQFTASSPFELVHSDLWGPASVNSINGFRYYYYFFFLFITTQGSLGFTYLSQNQRSLLNLFILKL